MLAHAPLPGQSEKVAKKKKDRKRKHSSSGASQLLSSTFQRLLSKAEPDKLNGLCSVTAVVLALCSPPLLACASWQSQC